MNALKAFGKKGGSHRAFGETFAGEGFVCEHKTVASAGKLYRVNAGDFPFAYGVDLRSGSEGTLPNNPLNTDSTDSTEACTHPRDAPAGQDVSFPDFCNAYRARGGKITAQQRTDSYDLWCSMSLQKRQAVMAELGNAEGFWRSRPDWLLADYQLPPPKNYNGSREFDAVVKTTPLVSAAYNGAYGIYTLDDARKYGMEIKCRMN